MGLKIPNTIINIRADEKINHTNFTGICTDYPLLYVDTNTK